jgi:hypothetical protein
MLFGKTKSKKFMCDYCLIGTIIIGVILAIATIASLVGVYMAHVFSDGLRFGTTSGSLSLLALGFNLFLAKKLMMSCPCQCDVPTPMMKLTGKKK